LFLYLILWDGRLTLPLDAHSPHAFTGLLVEYGFSACVAFTYLAVGLVVWLYVRDRTVGRLLLAFSLCGMAVFAVETIGTLGLNVYGDALADYASELGLYLLAVLLLVFPHNHLAGRTGKGWARGVRAYLPHAYLVLLTGLLVWDFASDSYTAELLFGNHALYYTAPSSAPHFWPPLIFLLTPLAALPITYVRASSPRVRQQARILGIGLLLGILPFAVGTVLPFSLMQPPPGILEDSSQVTTVFLALVPLALGYAILRYHVLLVDRYIRSAVTLLVGGVLLAVCAYLAFFFSGALLAGHMLLQVWSAAGACLVAIAAVWRIAPWVSNRLFAPDLAEAHRLMYGGSLPPEPLTGQAEPIEAVARLLMQSAQSILGAQHLCFLAFHRESDSYRPVVLPRDDAGEREGAPRLLLPLLLQALHGEAAQRGWLDAHEPLFARLAGSDHPLLLSEARSSAARRRASFGRVLAIPVEEENPLLVPLKTSKGALVGNGLAGVLVLGARDTNLPYAGPDMALIDILLVRFSWLLEAAMMEAQTRQRVAMLNTLSARPTAPSLPDEGSVEELATTYTQIVASAMESSAEIWFYHERDAHLRRVARAGGGPFLRQVRSLLPGGESDCACWFYEGGHQPWTGTGVPEPPAFPCAWLPLLHQGLPVGVLVLTYPHLHHLFSPAERQILELFAHQLATTLVSARLAGKLRADAASQRERARFKGQELLVHLRDLLQPLVGTQRYLGLLRMQDGHLVPAEEWTGLPGAHAGEAAPRPGESLAPALTEILTRLVTSTRESLSHLHTLAGRPGGEGDPTAIAAQVRSQVNAILRGFEEVRQPEVLVISPDAGLGTMLVSALSLSGYSPTLVLSCQQAVVWMRQRTLQEADPSVLILDSSSLRGETGLVDFTRELRAARPISTAQHLPPLLLVSAGEPWAAHLPEQSTLDAPFPVHAFLERVQSCIMQSPDAGD